MTQIRRTVIARRSRLSLFLLFAPLVAAAQAPVATPVANSIAARTAGFERRDGFVPLWLDTKQGRLYAELPREPLRALFWVSLASGFGSNPVGLDRGASGADQVVRFERDGDRVQMVFENTSFRTSLDDAAHRRSIEESFPNSNVAALPVLAEEGNRILTDLTDVAYRDWNDIAGTMSRLNQGGYSIARDRSSIDRAHTAVWAQAFERAGLPGAFRAELLPEGADPLDARYNVVQWENRNERGWSVGGSLGDPRTGQILKGMARLDSHRARTDYNLYAALMGADAAAADTAFVLARVRQVSAHEVGHTLGLQHNYIASTNERSSVMDYPAPRVRLAANGDLDISSAYGTVPGDYDVWAIRWGYGIFPPGAERDSLAAIVAEGLRKGYLYLSDAAARPENASDPRTSLWDDAATASEFLQHQTAVRRAALSRFGLRNIRVGEPVATLQERLAPLYFWHRFALNGVAKTLGGMEYSNTVRGDGQTATRPIDGARQRAALSALLAALQPSELAIPDTVIALMGPRPSGYDGPVNNSNSPVDELFRGRTDPAFDELSAARTLAQMIVDGMLQRERAARLVAFATRGPNMLTLGETIDSLVARTWQASDVGASPKLVALRRVTQRAVADRLLSLASDVEAAPEVRAMAEYQIGRLRTVARQRGTAGDTMNRAHWASIAGDFARWVERRELPRPTPTLVPPPGDPFGEP